MSYPLRNACIGSMDAASEIESPSRFRRTQASCETRGFENALQIARPIRRPRQLQLKTPIEWDECAKPLRGAQCSRLRSLRLHFFGELPELVLGNHFSVKQVHFTLRMFGEARIVGHHADGRAFAVEVGEQVHDGFAVFGIKVAGRLVGQQDGGRSG